MRVKIQAGDRDCCWAQRASVLGISHFGQPGAAEQSPSHPGVPFLTWTVQCPCSPQGKHGAPRHVDLAVWWRVLTQPCGPAVITFPERQGMGVWARWKMGRTAG